MNKIRQDITIEEILKRYNIKYNKTTPEEAKKSNKILDKYFNEYLNEHTEVHMNRKLASIQKISNIIEHPNADSLLIAKVLGWDVIIRKDDSYNVGDKIVYFEIDSFLPCVEEYEFLRKSSYKNSPIIGEGFRLKPIKLRGITSYGLILPIEVCFKNCTPLPSMDFEIGEDVTELLNVKKWEEPVKGKTRGNAVGSRPIWIEKSNEIRIQSEPELLNEFSDIPYYITTKYDGSSHFIGIDSENNFHFGSHNLELKPDESDGTFYSFIKKNDLDTKLLDIKKERNWNLVYIIGEWCGYGIQKNKLNLSSLQWFPFTVNADGKRLGLYPLQNVCEKLGIEHVAVEEVGKNLLDKYNTIDDLLERSKENRERVYPDKCEGIVIRPVNPIISKITNEYLSFKVINTEYIL